MQLLKASKVTLITKNNLRQLSLECDFLYPSAFNMGTHLWKNKQTDVSILCILGFSGGEMGEQLTEPEVLCLAKVQLLCRQ